MSDRCEKLSLRLTTSHPQSGNENENTGTVLHAVTVTAAAVEGGLSLSAKRLQSRNLTASGRVSIPKLASLESPRPS